MPIDAFIHNERQLIRPLEPNGHLRRDLVVLLLGYDLHHRLDLARKRRQLAVIICHLPQHVFRL